jgi:hypothetical protein
MPWHCPACSTVIRHPEGVDAVPRPGVVYRCSVCRLELMVDEKTGKLTVAPFPPDTEPLDSLRQRRQ